MDMRESAEAVDTASVNDDLHPVDTGAGSMKRWALRKRISLVDMVFLAPMLALQHAGRWGAWLAVAAVWFIVLTIWDRPEHRA